ncbi:hypothetical protein FIL88_15355 [Aliiroseovarius halocynthiae]|uniref:Uncharacterized protein n=2 Tax=Aliiroseovarius halocynthiae TaxID=985055 RepID=A0A545SLZ7_9RHOB|nr:hypothetical protein FIL88_15355 [Aliiroseovarius halocynthiae]
MTRPAITAAMKSCGFDVTSSAHGGLYFLENSVMAEFQPDGTASFIGVAPHRDLELTFQGVDLFKKHADEVFKLFETHEGETATDVDPHEHLFPKQIVTLWDPDTQYDLNAETMPVWGQIGIGNAQYMTDCAAL